MCTEAKIQDVSQREQKILLRKQNKNKNKPELEVAGEVSSQDRIFGNVVFILG